MRNFVKAVVNLLACAVVAPCALLYFVGSLCLGPARAFHGWSEVFSLLPGRSGIYLRRAFYAWVLPECGAGACICFGTLLSHPTAHVGRNVYVGGFCTLGDVTLEEDVLIGSHVSVINGSAQHGTQQLDRPIREQPGCWPRITIGRDTWIGERAIIMADVGKHCVIAAGSVVTKPIPDYAVAVGSPARVIRFRDHRPPTEGPAASPVAACARPGSRGE